MTSERVVDTVFRVRTDRFDREFILTMPGLFNVENALAAIAVAYVLKIPEEHIYAGLRRARSSGRMEYFANKAKDRIVIVDYAHNRLSFTRLYEKVKAELHGMKIVTVFGCPEERRICAEGSCLLAGMQFRQSVPDGGGPGRKTRGL